MNAHDLYGFKRRGLPTARRGFTLIELMVAVAVVAILAAIALPSYSAYVQRSRVPPMLDALSSYHARMEQRFQDTGSYGSDACAVSLPSGTNFSVACALSNSGNGFTATATGSGNLNGYRFTINHLGTRATTAHPRGVPSASCWSIKGGVCDDA